MSSPYTPVTLTGFNNSPPSNDGSEVASNQLDWDFHVDKLATPLKDLAEGINTNVAAAFLAVYGQTAAEAAAGVTPASFFFLPGDARRYGIDGTGDDSAGWRDALSVSGDHPLYLEPGKTYTVSQDGANAWCIRADTIPNIVIYGNGATIQNTDGALQILRFATCNNLRIHDLFVDGPGTNGADLGAGLLQIDGGTGIHLNNVGSSNSDQDGIAIANATFVRAQGLSSNNDSKAGIYINNCDDVIVNGVRIRDAGGHTVSGNTVGLGAQLSGNRDMTFTNFFIDTVVGTGLRCNNISTNEPRNNIIGHGVIIGAKNPSNINESFGLRATNGATSKVTNSLFHDILIRDCGIYGVYLENHNGARLSDIKVIESDRDGFLVSTCVDFEIIDCAAWNSDTTASGSKFSMQIINAADGGLIKNFSRRNSAEYTSGSATLAVNDTSSGTHTFEGLQPEAVGPDRGDATYAIVNQIDAKTQLWATTLTANRTASLSTGRAYEGLEYTIVRTGLGAFTLDVGGLYTIPNSTAEWVTVVYDGSAWILKAKGPLT